MSNKLNNSKLLIAFAILIGLFVFFKFYRNIKTESSINTSIVKFDTTEVTSILLYPKQELGKEIKFFKENNIWKVTDGKIISDVEPSNFQNFFKSILEIKPERLAAKSKEKFSEYELTDSASTRLKVLVNNKVELDLLIGKFTYQQSNNQYAQYGGNGGGITGTSYVRLRNEQEIYAVNGFLSFSFNQPFKSWRNQTFIRLNSADITKLSFKYPSDSSFIANLDNGIWKINGLPADSTKIGSYIGSIAYKNATEFVDNYVPVGNPNCEITIEGKSIKPISIKVYQLGSKFIFNSSLNPKVYFEGINDLFKSEKDFLIDKKK